MPTTYNITATAEGSLTPTQIPYSEQTPTLTNGDFSIRGNPTNEFIGTGVNEFTNWSFDFTSCKDCPTKKELELGLVKLRDARLKMMLEPKSVAISTDSVMIEGLTRIHSSKITNLPVGTTATIDLDLLNLGSQSYEPVDVLRIFREGEFGQVPMEYEEDAIIGYATLELTLQKTS